MNLTTPSRALTEGAEPIKAPQQKAGPASKARRRRWPWVVGVLLIAAAGGYTYWLRQAPPPVEVAAPVARPVQLLPIEVTTITPSLLRDQVSIAGSLQPIRQAALSFQSGGKIEEILVKTGERVAAGAPVARLDTADFAAKVAAQRGTIAATQAQLALAQKQLASTSTLAAKEIASRASLDSAQANVNAQEASLAAQRAQLESLELTLNNTTLTAPFAGRVSARGAEPGQTVGSGAAVVTIVDLSEMEFEGTAPVNAAALLSEGQSVEVVVEGLRGETFAGTVERISPVAISGTRSIPIFVRINNPGERLRGGMFATGKVTVAEAENAVAIPSAGIRNDEQGTFVLAVRDGKLERVAVEVVRTWNGTRLTEITGVNVGDVVVSAALPGLQAGATAVVTGE